MGFMDKLKSAGESVKGASVGAAERAKSELDEQKTRRQLADLYEQLGRKTYELAHAGPLNNEALTSEMEEIRKLEAHLAEGLAAQQKDADL